MSLRGCYEIWAVSPLPAPPDAPDTDAYQAVFWRYGPTMEQAEAYIAEHADDKPFYDPETDTVYTYLVIVEGGTW